MAFKQRLILTLISLVIIFILSLTVAHHHAKGVIKRDFTVLMNDYFRYKEKKPLVARKALDIILQQNPTHLPALIELSQWLIEKEQFSEALPLLKTLYAIKPNEKIYLFQLAYTHHQLGEWDTAKAHYSKLIASDASIWRIRAKAALESMASFIPHYKDWVDATFFSSQWYRDNPIAAYLDQFYNLRAKNKKKAHAYIKTLIEKYPTNIDALREAGLLAIEDGRITDAIEAFTRSYAITGSPETAMQLGYLYTTQNLNKQAYYYFNRATYTHDQKLSTLAQDAMTRLAGQQTQAFSKPYYGEFFFMPFTQSRFGITVSQFIGRLGVELPLPMSPRVYSFTRRTQDNRENNTGELTQLYEDNVWVTGIGGQLFPFRTLPLFIYVEGGAAHDLFLRARERWRADLRGGFMYYQEVGKMPSYYPEKKYSLDYYGIWYAEMTYFSRYDNNVIASIRTHQGIRLFQYKSSMVNLFIRGRVIEDTNRDFYNNFVELGPGLGIIPSNRYNLEIHLDYINGMYLPAGGKQRNPFAKYYSNRRALLLFYAKL